MLGGGRSHASEVAEADGGLPHVHASQLTHLRPGGCRGGELSGVGAGRARQSGSGAERNSAAGRVSRVREDEECWKEE